MTASYDPQSASRYLESQVTTASQPRLQVMLLDGAIQSARRARQLCQDADQWDNAEAHIAKATEIVAALVQGAAQGKSEISKRLEEEYAFLFRELTGARLSRDLAKVDAAINLLEYERETWNQASLKFAETASQNPADSNGEATHPPAIPPTSTITAAPLWDDAASGFSIEA